MEYEFLIDGTERKLSLERKGREGQSYIIREGEREVEADIRPITANMLSVLIEGRSHIIHLARDRETLHLFYKGRCYDVLEPSEEGAAAAGGGAKSREDMLNVSAPMPGKVIKVSVKEGEEVREKQTLVIVEAMKMENEVKAELGCRVKKICCAPGDLVDVTNILVELEELETDSV
jgi:acetyl/propionyl-CoA carboxylase alpha subunit